jgi:hypothetical protein
VTSDEIRLRVAAGTRSNPPLYETFWLKEIALQLAIMNERSPTAPSPTTEPED